MNLGITNAAGLEWMLTFECGCWRRYGRSTDELLNSHDCMDHRDRDPMARFDAEARARDL